MEYPSHARGMDISPAEREIVMGFPGCLSRAEMNGPTDNDGEIDGGYGDGGCGCPESPCGHSSWGLVRYPLAMVYAPCQNFGGLYDPDTALGHGTLFAELDLPLEVGYAKGCCRQGKKGGEGLC